MQSDLTMALQGYRPNLPHIPEFNAQAPFVEALGPQPILGSSAHRGPKRNKEGR